MTRYGAKGQPLGWYEYCYCVPDLPELNRLGAEGWHVVGSVVPQTGSRLMERFVRPKPALKPARLMIEEDDEPAPQL